MVRPPRAKWDRSTVVVDSELCILHRLIRWGGRVGRHTGARSIYLNIPCCHYSIGFRLTKQATFSLNFKSETRLVLMTPGREMVMVTLTSVYVQR